MNVLLSWLLTHWRIVAPTAAAVVSLITTAAQPGGLVLLASNWAVILPAAVGLVTWCVHAYGHVRDNTPITEDFPVLANLSLAAPLPEQPLEPFAGVLAHVAPVTTMTALDSTPTPPASSGNG